MAEVDDESCFYQNVCVMPSASYTFSMKASRRTSGGPNPCTTHINIVGLNAAGTAIATYVDMDFTRTNTAFSLTPVTGIPVINVPPSSGVVRLKITLTDNTAGTSTLGMIVDDLSLVMNTPPTVASTITGTSTCPNVNQTLSVSGISGTGISYYWSLGSGAVTPNGITDTTNSPTVYWTTPSPVAVSVIISNSVCFYDTLDYTLTVSSGSTVITYDTICSGTSRIFGNDTLIASGIYTDSMVAVSGCDSIVSLHLYVRPPLPAPVISGLQVYCQDALPSSFLVSGTGIQWYATPSSAPTTVYPTVPTAVPGVYTYYASQSYMPGYKCPSPLDSITVVVHPRPAVPTVTNPSYCQGTGALPLSAVGDSVRWYTSISGGVGTYVAPTPSTATPGTTTWYVTFTDSGCESYRAPQVVTILSTPNFVINSSALKICRYDTLNLSYTASVGAPTQTWSLPAGFNVISGSETSTAVSVTCDAVAGNYPIYLMLSGPGGICSTTDTIAITITPEPSANLLLAEGGCLGDTVLVGIADRSDNAAEFTWSVDGNAWQTNSGMEMVANNSNSSGPYKVRWLTTGLHVIKLISISAEGCTSLPVYDSIKINALPVSDFTYVDNGMCLEDSLLFKADTNRYDYFYRWNPSQYFTATDQPYTYGTVSVPNGKVSLTVTDAYGCNSTTVRSIPVQSCCKVTMPTAFTPNRDKVNDVFRPVFQGYHRFHVFRIVNRWGQTVFESTNNNVSWDGTFGGEPQDMGVYFYYLQYDCGGETLEETGDVTLIR